MNIVVFDTETTGFRNGHATYNGNSYRTKGEVIQLSCIVSDEDMKPKQFISFYCQPSEPISDQALEVHKISNNSILALSKGKTLEDYLYEHKDLFSSKGNIFIGYNISFDISAINNTLKDYGIPQVDFGDTVYSLGECINENNNYNLDIMQVANSYLKEREIYRAPKYPKLSEAIDALGASRTVDKLFNLFQSYFHLNSSILYHNSDYDTTATWYLVKKVLYDV